MLILLGVSVHIHFSRLQTFLLKILQALLYLIFIDHRLPQMSKQIRSSAQCYLLIRF